MPSRKRARTSASASAAADDTPPPIVISGGHAYPPEVVSLWEDRAFCDVDLTAGGDTHKVRRLVICAASPY